MKTKLNLTLTAFMAAVVLQPHASGAGPSLDKPVIPNRTVPKVTPPKSGLEFSAQPTTQEISEAWVFEERLVPIGEPTVEENAAMAAALLTYSKRSGPDDFSSLTQFLRAHPRSPWRAAVLTVLGLEYYGSARYSLAVEAWDEGWTLAQEALDVGGKFLADRAVCELAGLYSRLGRTPELEALLKSVENRSFLGGAAERIHVAREALWRMQTRPDVSYRCGPLALQSIQFALDPQAMAHPAIRDSASTPRGFSLTQVAELAKTVGLNYQMAFRGASKSEIRNPRSEINFVVPSVVHWKSGHYAAIVGQSADRYQVQDPTFGKTVWATKQAIEEESSGYFLLPPGKLPPGWRTVGDLEGASVWGKGQTGIHDPDRYTQDDLMTGQCNPGIGMAVSSVHLMLANLQIRDTPIGYTPPVGPPVRFTVRYNQRDYLQPPSLSISPFSPRWTHDWYEMVKDDPNNSLADVKYLPGGGGGHTFTGTGTGGSSGGSSAIVPMRLKRTGTNSYEMLYPDGSKKIFDQRLGTSGLLLLTRWLDPAGNAVTLTWTIVEGVPLLVALTDAIGQVTTLHYTDRMHPFILTLVRDPFGREARFDYIKPILRVSGGGSATNFIQLPLLAGITDVLGLHSQFSYRKVDTNNVGQAIVTDQIEKMVTPYGTTTFTTTETNLAGGIRAVETMYPDGSRDRVEFNQSITNIPQSEPAALVPQGMAVPNVNLRYRNTYYWSRTASASSYGDYTKAKIYHWLHLGNFETTAGILESTKEPLENRVWYYYGQHATDFAGEQNLPTHIGRVQEDGQTQLYRTGYNRLRNLTNSVDPVGRTFSLVYATNDVDLLEVRQTRAGNNELLFRATYNDQHRPLTIVDAAGQTNTFTYNARGQLLTATNPKGEVAGYTYDGEGYQIAMDGPLPGTNDTLRTTYDLFGRIRSVTGLTGYTMTYDYDVMDRITRITHPDQTFEEVTYERLDPAVIQDRAGRQTLFQYDDMGQVKTTTDPLGRVTRFDWCRCGQIKSLTDPMGQTTTWLTDVQGRNIAKRYADGSQVTYQYENASSRLHLMIDEKQQVTQFAWNRDDTLQSLAYHSAVIPTPGVSFQYDPDYERAVSMTDGTGTTRYSYNPVTGTPALGAGGLASVDGPLPNDTMTYAYDELNRPVHRAINGVGVKLTFDEAGRLAGVTNALGTFTYGYDGSTIRLVSKSLPNGQAEERSYGNNVQDRTLQRITHTQGATPVSEFLYGHDVTRGRITTWSQQVGATPPSLHTLGYDAVNQLLSDNVTNTGNLITTFAYTYDPSGNRLTEQIGASTHVATYNGLNEIRTTTAPGASRTNEWDALDRFVAVNGGNQRTEFTYDGLNRRVAIRQLVNDAEVSHRRFVWCDDEICEERDGAGTVTKRFFPQGMKVESGPNAGTYYYTRDHLGSIRELTDANGNVRARYAYDPFGRRTKLTGDLDADFGFAGMFWSAEANLSLTLMRAYDPALGRWLSRDPLPNTEMSQGPNLYAYVANDPVNYIDPYGLAGILNSCTANPVVCSIAMGTAAQAAPYVQRYGPSLQRWSPFIQRANTAAQCGQKVAARVPGALEGAVLQLERIELVVEAPAVRSIGQRASDLGRLFRTTVGRIDFQILREHGFETDELYAVSSEFYQIAWDLHLLERIQFSQAWQKLANLLGFNPGLWGNL
jgi:RHS repeat-associated protein